MRTPLAAFCALAALAAPGAAQETSPGWSYAYVEGAAVATQRDDRGHITATLSCRPPDGDIILADPTLARAARRATSAAVGVGNLTVNVPSTVERQGRDRVLVIHLPQRPPILAGVQPHDVITVTVGRESRTYLDGSAQQMRDVAFACWGS